MTSRRKVALLLLASDVLSIGLAFNAVGALRGIYGLHGPILFPLLVPLALLLAALYLIDGYNAHADMLSLDYTSQHTIALLSAMLVTLLITFVVIPGGYSLQTSRAVIALSFIALVPVTLGTRRFLYSKAAQRRNKRSLVFIGDTASAQSFSEECEYAGMVQPVIHATLHALSAAESSQPDAAASVPFSNVLERIRNGSLKVEAIILRESNRELSPEVSQQLVDLYFGGIATYTLELFHQVYWRKIPLYRLNQTWLFQEGFEIAREPVFERTKRLTDVALATLTLIVTLPLFALVALAIWLEDRGPVFFKQTRIGKNRAPFPVYKFRSMRPDVGGAPYAQEGDRRITRVGRILRASRIDELPQVLNVIRGEMSLIGPRAEWDRLVADYEAQIPCYHFRHLVRPGITGWAQVNYPYGAGIDDTLKKLEYDLYYIRHFSFSLDASIVLKTMHVMLFGKGR